MLLIFAVLDDCRKKCFYPKATSQFKLNYSCWMCGKALPDSLGIKAIPTTLAAYLTHHPVAMWDACLLPAHSCVCL